MEWCERVRTPLFALMIRLCEDNSKEKYFKILGRSKPRKLLIASTAPQIRYPDCYGIDMSELGKFIAFQAAISLIQERGYHGLLDEVAENAEKP